jgi:hypothetical protein
MSQQNYWRVKVKGGRRFHLTAVFEGHGPQPIALCGQPLSEEKRSQPTPRTVVSPIGDECEECLYQSGHRQRPQMTAEERRLLNRWKAIAEAPEHLRAIGLSDPQIKSIMEAALGISNQPQG